MMLPTRRTNTDGFTLLEIIVVLVLMGLAMGLVAPTVGAGVESFRLQAAGSQVVAAFRQAQSAARLQQTSILAVYSNHQFVFSKNHQIVRTLSLSPLVETSPSDLIAYMFLPTGQVLGPSQIELSTGNNKKRIVFSLGPTPSEFGIGGTAK
jgi:prepilin-type N-terminal cleavage/methylation domain-containing protein